MMKCLSMVHDPSLRILAVQDILLGMAVPCTGAVVGFRLNLKRWSAQYHDHKAMTSLLNPNKESEQVQLLLGNAMLSGHPDIPATTTMLSLVMEHFAKLESTAVHLTPLCPQGGTNVRAASEQILTSNPTSGPN